MNEMTLDTVPNLNMQAQTDPRRTVFGLRWPVFALIGIMLLSAVLHFVNLDAIGNGNTYYTAAVESMLQSWENFFFVAAEPGGSVTVDKPPLGLWLQAISAFLLGVSGFSVVLPQIIAGILSIPVVYHLVKRYSGETAGVIAAFVLAVTPVSIAAERNNTMDATLMFTLLLAAWAFVKATDEGKLRWLLAGGVLIGLAFNIKMLQAFLPVPAFYAVYLLGSKEGWWRKLLNLGLAIIVLLAVSFSWAIGVDLTPADQRPYVGSSADNTVSELILGHNGLSRLLGGRQANAILSGQPVADDGPGSPAQAQPQQGPNNGQPGQLPQGGPPAQSAGPNNDGRPAPPNQAGGQDGPGGNDEIGDAGVLRLFTAPLSNEIGWLLPFGLLSIGIVVVSNPLRFPLKDEYKGLVLWGGMLVIMVVFFSIAEFFHAYYLTMLAAPLAALVAMGVVALWRQREHKPLLAWGALIAAAVGSVVFQAYTVFQYVDTFYWLIVPVLLLAAASLSLIANGYLGQRSLAVIGLVCLIAAMLVTPTVWSFMTAFDESPHVGLPSGYEDTGEGGPAGADRHDNMDQALLDYLQANTQDMTYMLAVPNAFSGAGYIIETGRPVLYMGGFSGNDPVVSAADLAEMTAQGELRYILWGRDNRGGENKREMSEWLQNACVPVEQFSSQGGQPAGGPPDGPGGGGNTLYQCGG